MSPGEHTTSHWSTSSPSPSATVPPKYQFTNVGPLCEKVDVTPLKAIFETQASDPDSTRNPGTGYGSAHCIISLTHTDSTGLGDSIVTLSFSLWIYENVATAVRAQQRDRDNAAKNKANPADEPGIGEQAFTFGKSGATQGPGKSVECTLEVLDVNLVWTATIRADRIASNNWSQQQRTNIDTAFRSTAKRSYTNAIAF
jgi:hypothetical protein